MDKMILVILVASAFLASGSMMILPVNAEDEMTVGEERDVEYETEGDPTTHTPTDESIEVSIDFYGAEFDDSGDHVEMEIGATGSTTGTVVKCAMTIVTYMKNGTYEVGEWDVGPYDEPETTSYGVTLESYFKGINGEGDDDWSSWGFKMYIGVLEELYNLSMNMGMDFGYEMNVENVSRVVMVVRAFSNDDMTMWNQDTKDVTDEYKAFISGESTSKDDDGGLPGFELFGAVVAFVAVAGLGLAFRRRR